MRDTLRVWLSLAVAIALGFAAGSAYAQAFTSYVTSGLSGPVAIVNAHDSSNRLFVAQQGGALRVIRNDVLQATPLITLSSATTCRPAPAQNATTVGFTSGGERGLLGVAFHPLFGSNGQVFLSFTDVNGDTMIARWTMASSAADVMTAGDLGSCVVILRIDQDGSNHNGGNIVFGPDGYLYLGRGDGGGGASTPDGSGGGDTCNRAQTLDPTQLAEAPNNCAVDANFVNSGGQARSRALLGKMLRIDVDNVAAGGNLCGTSSGFTNYAIPPGNPFAGAAAGTRCDEVWSYGLRNPWRWGFDRVTHDLIIGDVGQNAIEEVDFEFANTPGTNYGWHCYEGNNAYTACSPMPANTPPIITYSHASSRCSITGGYRYRGPVLGVQGNYFYADYCTGEVWSSTFDGLTWSQPGAPFVDLSSTVTTFGEDEAGNLYVTNGSQILKLTGPTLPADLLFADGFE
jgi:glucose/arabinose dehydrogenase